MMRIKKAKKVKVNHFNHKLYIISGQHESTTSNGTNVKLKYPGLSLQGSHWGRHAETEYAQ